MMTDDVGRADLFRDQKALDARTATRMTIGGTIDNLFIIGLRASPIWLLLAATDITREAQRFTRELAEELKRAGVMREGCRLDSVDEVLEGLSRLSDRMADTLDQPPLSLGEMKATVSALKEEVGGVTETAIMETADLDGLARDLLDLRHQADRSLLELSAAIAAGTWRTASNIVLGTAVGTTATVRILGARLWKDVVLDYRDAARSIWRRGFYGSIRSFLRPQTRSYRRLFAWPFLTLTEIGLSLGRWRKAPWRLGGPAGRHAAASALPRRAPAEAAPEASGPRGAESPAASAPWRKAPSRAGADLVHKSYCHKILMPRPRQPGPLWKAG